MKMETKIKKAVKILNETIGINNGFGYGIRYHPCKTGKSWFTIYFRNENISAINPIHNQTIKDIIKKVEFDFQYKYQFQNHVLKKLRK